MSKPVIDIVALDAPTLERRIEDLAGVLQACVHGGAAVNFVLPFETANARTFWREKVTPSVAKGRRIVLAACAEDRVAGTVQLDLDTPPNQPHRGEVAKPLVHPDFRRLGVARQLMAALEDHAVRAGRTLLTLDTRAGDAAEPLYLSLGYEIAGRIPDYARNAADPGFHATTIMFKRLSLRAHIVTPTRR